MKVPRELRAAMVQHAVREAPLEACGIVGGVGDEARSFYPCRNAAESPVRYRIDPLEILHVLQELDRRGETLVGIFHSHPATEAYPSATDVREAHYPDARYLIASLAGPEPVLRAFTIRDGMIRVEALEVEEAGEEAR